MAALRWLAACVCVLVGCGRGGTTGGSASCEATVDCYSACSSAADCLAACDRRAGTGVAELSRAVLDCVGRSGCADQDCAVRTCEAELARCAAPAPTAAAPTAAPPTAAGDQSSTAALAGEWKKGDRSAADYAAAGGGFATSNVTVSQESYRFDGAGAFVHRIDGASNQGQVHATTPGRYWFDAELLVLATERERRYRVVSWQVTDALTVMTLLYETYPVDDTNIMYNGEVWVRAR